MANNAKRRRKARGAQSPGIWQRGKWWFVGSGIVGALALLVGLTFALSGTEVSGGEDIVAQVADLPSPPGGIPDRFDFPITLYQGEEFIGASELGFGDLLGGQPIVMNYWASNCPPCRAEMPGFQRVWKRYSDRVLFFGLDIGRFAGFGGPEVSKRQLQSLGVTYPAAAVPNQQTMQGLRVQGLPTTEFITSEGIVVKSWTGQLNEAKLTEMIESLLSVN